MKKVQKMFALALVVIGLSFGVAGCEKPQEPAPPTTPPAGEMKKDAPKAMTTPATTPAATPAAPAGNAKATTSTAPK